jgi:hypothetical protein
LAPLLTRILSSLRINSLPSEKTHLLSKVVLFTTKEPAYFTLKSKIWQRHSVHFLRTSANFSHSSYSYHDIYRKRKNSDLVVEYAIMSSTFSEHVSVRVNGGGESGEERETVQRQYNSNATSSLARCL